MSEAAEAPKQEWPKDHQCEQPGCQKQGGWGYERHDRTIDWRCYEHRDLDYRPKSR